ncbi:MAG: VanZ family protein [Candidatus Competibacteraceae bacterium]
MSNSRHPIDTNSRPAGKETARLLGIGLFCLGAIIYGSLIPFDFTPRFSLAEAWETFLKTPYFRIGAEGRADWVANLLIYIPPAFFLCGASGIHKPKGRSFLGFFIALSLCGMVAVGVEFTQLYFPPRTVSLNDLLAEFIGTLLGIFLWYLCGKRLYNYWQSVYTGGPHAVKAAVILYVSTYLIICLFPYDFIVSSAELRTKFDSDAVGIFLAGLGCDSSLRCVIKQLTEILISMPLGILLAWLWGVDKPTTLRRVLFTGFIIGSGIELIQLLEISGISQGISVLNRILGMGLGCWLLQRLKKQPLRIAPVAVKFFLILLLPPYLLLLARLNGGFSQAWLSWGEARRQLATLQWLPFYYHYFSTETNAMASLVLIACSYAPLGLGLWLWRGRPGRAGYWLLPMLPAGGCALLIEAGKLFLSLRPDPTNILIAACSASLVYSIAAWMQRWNQTTTVPPGRSVTAKILRRSGYHEIPRRSG